MSSDQQRSPRTTISVSTGFGNEFEWSPTSALDKLEGLVVRTPWLVDELPELVDFRFLIRHGTPVVSVTVNWEDGSKDKLETLFTDPIDDAPPHYWSVWSDVGFLLRNMAGVDDQDLAEPEARIIDAAYEPDSTAVGSPAEPQTSDRTLGVDLDVSVFINGGFALDDNGLVQRSGPSPFEDQSLAGAILDRVVSDGVSARVGPRPGWCHIEVSPDDPTRSIRVKLPSGYHDIAPIGRTLASLADDIALLVDGAHPDTVDVTEHEARPTEAAAGTTITVLELRRPAVSSPERDGELPSSLEDLLRLANSMYLNGVWASDQDADRRVKRRIDYLTSYQSFPSFDDSAEQRQAEAMTAALSADILHAVKEAAGIDLPGLDQVLSAAGHLSGTDGTDSDPDRAKDAAGEIERARQSLLDTLRSSRLELPIDLDLSDIEDPGLVQDLWSFDQQGEKNGKTLGMAIGGVGGAIVGATSGFAIGGPIGAIAGAVTGLGAGGRTGKYYGEILGAVATVIGSILRRFERKPPQ